MTEEGRGSEPGFRRASGEFEGRTCVRPSPRAPEDLLGIGPEFEPANARPDAAGRAGGMRDEG